MPNTVGVPFYHIDAFTDAPFGGNPAAVCLLRAPKDAAWMQRVAAEMQLSETAFVVPQSNGYQLRWFTPAVEVDLCGHATLAAAHALWEHHNVARAMPINFHTASGTLTAHHRGEWIELDFPALTQTAIALPPALLDTLGAVPSYVGGNDTWLLAELDGEALVRDFTPDIAKLKALPAQALVITAACEKGPYDFVSRVFAPKEGIDEDPVTGSAHCLLGPYWQHKLGRNEFTAYQASARGGIVHVRVHDSRVMLGGQAVTVVQGELR